MIPLLENLPARKTRNIYTAGCVKFPLPDFYPFGHNSDVMPNPWDWDRIIERANARSRELYNKAAVTYFEQQSQADLLNLRRPRERIRNSVLDKASHHV